MLAPGIAGVTDRIRVRSIVGRFLEHSRVAYFRWGDGDDDEAVFLSSADWMGRNMFGRVEVAWPVRDRRLAPARSSTNAWFPTCTTARTPWLQRSDGSYERVAERRRVGAGSAHAFAQGVA